jgi:hypothetical protein
MAEMGHEQRTRPVPSPCPRLLFSQKLPQIRGAGNPTHHGRLAKQRSIGFAIQACERAYPIRDTRA